MPVALEVKGLDKALSLLDVVGESAREVGRTRYRISSPLPYAHWIEEGRYAGGRPGRTAARHMLAKGRDRMEELAPPAVVRTLERGPRAVRDALAGVAGEATKVAKAATPVVSGNLRASIYSTTVGRRAR